MPGVDDVLQEVLQAAIIMDSIGEARDTMFSMVGNAGQESILADGMGTFTDWGMGMVVGIDDNVQGQLQEDLGQEKYSATDQIWETGESIVQDAAEGFI